MDKVVGDVIISGSFGGFEVVVVVGFACLEVLDEVVEVVKVVVSSVCLGVVDGAVVGIGSGSVTTGTVGSTCRVVI